jgi:hypothetical protein
MKGMSTTMELEANVNSQVSDFLETNGLLPRDGGLRFALDGNDNIVTGQIVNAPNNLILGLPDNIVSVWVETLTKSGKETKTILEDGTELYVPGLKENEHAHVFVYRKSTSSSSVKRLHGYRFRPGDNAYINGDIVCVKVPASGSIVKLFDSHSGKESMKLVLETGRVKIEAIRGLWCVGKIMIDASEKMSVLYQPSLTYIPPNFEPIANKARQNNTNSTKKRSNKRLKGVRCYEIIDRKLPWSTGLAKGITLIKGLSQRDTVIIAGKIDKKRVLGRKIRNVKGINGQRITLVNSYRAHGAILHKNDSLHLRIPIAGNLVTIFNPLTDSNDQIVQIHLPPGVSFTNFREKWMIGKVFNNSEEGQILQVKIDLELSMAHQSNFEANNKEMEM